VGGWVGGWVGVVWGKLRSACDKYDVLLDLCYLPKKSQLHNRR
jgi:hypothetical protein